MEFVLRRMGERSGEMSEDIVTRLRDTVKGGWSSKEHDDEMLTCAADEIERLQSETRRGKIAVVAIAIFGAIFSCLIFLCSGCAI